LATKLLLIRHGGTLLSAEDRFAGSTDVELSDQGRAQAAALARRLSELPIAAIYCSDMKRAIHTAEPLAAMLRLNPVPLNAFREIDHGQWEGRVHREVESEPLYAKWSVDPFTIAPPSGETGAAVLARSLPALRELIDKHPDQTIALASHKATNRLLLAALLGLDMKTYRDRLAQDLACLNVIVFRSWGNPQIVLMNDTSHYRAME
jgi:probable phosphoglycerate mutase